MDVFWTILSSILQDEKWQKFDTTQKDKNDKNGCFFLFYSNILPDEKCQKFDTKQKDKNHKNGRFLDNFEQHFTR